MQFFTKTILFVLCPYLSLCAVENTPWLLPILEPEMTIGIDQPLRATKKLGAYPVARVSAQGTLSENNEIGVVGYTRPSSLSLSYERQLSNDLDVADFVASSLFVQMGNALPWNVGFTEKSPFSLLGGVRLGCHYYMKGESYGQVFTSLGMMSARHKSLQDMAHVGMNYALDGRHKVQMEGWALFGKRKSDNIQALMMTYSYRRQHGDHWTVGLTFRKVSGRSEAPFISLSYSLPFFIGSL